MAYRYPTGRLHAKGLSGPQRNRGLRRLAGAPPTRQAVRRRSAASSGAHNPTKADLEYALVWLGAYLLVRGTRDLVQRVLQSIAARESSST
jgi:hypothetical protein